MTTRAPRRVSSLQWGRRFAATEVFLRARRGAACRVRSCVALPIAQRYSSCVTAAHAAFWDRHPGLVWSNPDASDDVRICAMLLRPRFLDLLDIVLEFGADRIGAKWQALREEDTPEARRAAPVVERILRNVQRGMALAVSGH